MERIFKSLAETIGAGRRIGSLLRPGDVVALNGPLGVGKTSFVGGLAAGIGTDPGFAVTSPTFVFAHVYEGRIPLYHIDLYRVERENELAGIGLEEMLGGDGVAVVEWFDRFPSVWTSDRLSIDLSFAGANERKAVVTGCGPRGEQLAARVAEAG